MRPSPRFSTAFLVALGLLSGRAQAAPGPHLSWDHCSADGQVANKNFACNTNSGTDVLVVSFESPVAASFATGIEMTFQIASSSGAVPGWWSLSSAGGCRTTSLSSNLIPQGPTVCDDPYLGQGASAAGAYVLDFYGPGTARMLGIAAMPSPMTITVGPGVETYALTIGINHSRTVGSACSGCNVPMCLGIGLLRLVGPDPGQTISLDAGGPNIGGGASVVTWQGAYVANYTVQGSSPNLFVSFACAPNTPIPTRRESWGSVKALYR